ncbi:MAG: MFS transporter [Erythrobacter sp.]|uniref:MFS transporter n=1 Tax=Erythrobacter sp. TaxID=1042 RepID=UPI003267A391
MTQTSASGAAPSRALALPALSENRVARFATIMVLYFLQGVPAGLTTVALTAWLAAKGATPVEIGAFVAFALLPWSAKLFNGLLMDRFTFKPMGRRRSWILAAQGLMIATLLVMAALAPTANEIALLSGLCFVLNLCAAFNDVAVDGLAVDIVPNSERTGINSVMFASQSAGIALTSVIAGGLLMSGDITTTALVLAALVAVASVFVGIFRERPGERLTPWSNGTASPECLERQQDAFWPIITGVIRSLFNRHVLLFLAGLAFAQAPFAFAGSVSPTLAVQHLGFSSEGYSNFVAAATLVAAGTALILPAPLVLWLGLSRAVIVQLAGLAILCAAAGLTLPNWQGDTAFMIYDCAIYALSLSGMITLISWAMRICSPAVAATQFALFMASANLAQSIYSANSGFVIEMGGYSATYLFMSVTSLIGLLLCLLARVGDEKLVTNHDD